MLGTYGRIYEPMPDGYYPIPRRVNAEVARWRIATLRGDTTVINPMTRYHTIPTVDSNSP